MSKHIYPIFNNLLGKNDKENLLKQRGLIIWMCGLSGAGKSTLATALQLKLHQLGYMTQVLDGDNIRMGLNRDLGFGDDDRTENIRRIGEVAKLFGASGIVTICSFISPTEKMRKLAKSIVGNLWYEVFVNAPELICEKRDVKGLYKKAREGKIKSFTSVDAPFEPPKNPQLIIDTHATTVDKSVQILLNAIQPRIIWKKKSQ